jgi:hypothetical protein
MVLSDLRHDQWTVVAVRVVAGDLDTWQWQLDLQDRNALRMAQEAGRVLTHQKRGEDGKFRLYARLARRRLSVVIG